VPQPATVKYIDASCFSFQGEISNLSSLGMLNNLSFVYQFWFKPIIGGKNNTFTSIVTW
jgi:hypothetical protein